MERTQQDTTQHGATDLQNVGFIGLGHMGGNMAARLLAAGHTVYGESRTREAGQWLVDQGPKNIGFDFFEEYCARLPDFGSEDFAMHRVILGAGVVIMEGLTNLGTLPRRSEPRSRKHRKRFAVTSTRFGESHRNFAQRPSTTLALQAR